MVDVIKKLSQIQGNLKAPKGQTNAFGKYKYRSAEDILEAVKPHLSQHGLVLTLSDEMVALNDRIYVKAVARLTDGEKEYHTVAYAREEETKKGMDGSQVTGAASSYARKYALNGLFCIDDTKDSDATNNHGKAAPAAAPKKKTRAEMKVIFDKSLAHINSSKNRSAAVKQVLEAYGDQFTADQVKKLKAIDAPTGTAK